MSEFFVSLSSIEDVRQFVNAADTSSTPNPSWACAPWISPTR